MLDRSLIAGLAPFKDLNDESLDRILKEARSARYAKNASVFEQEEEARAF